MVAEAHAVLSNPQRRERYDLGEDENGVNGNGGGGRFGGMNPSEMDEILAQFAFGGGGGGRGHTRGFSF